MFKTKYTNTVSATGTTYGKRQNYLNWLNNLERSGQKDDVAIVLRREKNNKYDPNAIRIGVHGRGKGKNKFDSRYGDLGYVDKQDACDLAKYMDAGKWVEIVNWYTVGGGDFNYGLRLDLKVK